MKKFYYFLCLFLFSSICYANSEVFTDIDNMSPFIMNQIIEKIDNASSLYQNSSTAINNFNSFKSNYDIEQVCSSFNNFFSDKSIDYFENCSMMIGIYDSKFCLRVCQNNNTHHATYPFIKIWARSSTETDFEYVDSNSNAVNNKPYYIVSFNSNGSLSYISTSAPYSRIGEVYGQIPTFVDSIVNCPYLISFNSIQNAVCFYKNGNNAGFWGFVDNIVLLNEPQPEEPSGENTGLGYITNSSGENGGSINLEPINQNLINIKNQISGDTQKVIENQNQNTRVLLSSILSFNSGEAISQINSIRDIDFDLANSVYQYETLFFSGDSSGDLILSWSPLKYSGEILIPSGEINFSAMVRENEQLGKLHHITQVFSIVSFGILLISGYWNLILATIGASSHLFVENSVYSEALESNTSIASFEDALPKNNVSRRYDSSPPIDKKYIYTDKKGYTYVRYDDWKEGK